MDRETTNDWLARNCNFQESFRSPKPVVELDGRHLEFERFYFMVDEYEDGCGSGLMIPEQQEGADYIEVNAINRNSYGKNDGFALLGFFESIELVEKLLETLVAANMEPVRVSR